MELLILLLLTPSLIPAHRYRSVSPSSSSSSNDEPFLPIYPVYPYSPKLIKRGTERDLIAPLTAELYAPKLDARDSYTASFRGNYPRDPYYPTYNPYPKTSGSSSYPISNPVASAGFTPTGSYSSSSTSFASPNIFSTPNAAGYSNQNAAGYTGSSSYSPYSPGYSTNPYPYSPAPYGIYNSYSAPYTQPPPSPYTPNSYPNYNYQAPYFYANYYNQPYPALPPPPPPHPGHEYPEPSTSDESDEVESSGKSNVAAKKSESKKNRSKDNDSENSKEGQDGQFVDGGNNFLSSSTKDLDGQSTSYKAPSPYNQLAHLSDVHLRSVPIAGLPRTTYRVISVGGQPVGPDYPLPQSYAKVQQLEQIMSQTLAKLLAQNNANQAGQYQTHEQSDNSALISNPILVNQSPQSVIAKTGLAYVLNQANLAKPANGQGQFVSNYNRQNPVVIKVQDSNHGVQASSTILSKAAAKYADGHFPEKSITTVSLQQAPGIYIPPEAKDIKDDNSQSTEYNDYDSTSGQTYDNSNSGYKKNEQNYSIDQAGQGAPYHNSNLVTVQTPQPQNYQYPSFLSTQSSQQQQSRDYKTNLDDVNFSTKRNTKV